MMVCSVLVVEMLYGDCHIALDRKLTKSTTNVFLHSVIQNEVKALCQNYHAIKGLIDVLKIVPPNTHEY